MMKTKIAAAVLFAAFMTMAPRPAEASWSVSISFFHEELAPYGRWVTTPAYGEVWYPTVVAAGWAPYVDGEWVYTDCGWTWVSYDPFSDPFHYGTWVWVDPYGWCWEPGYVWGPAWVTWAWTDTYVGWAPLPATFVITSGGYFGDPVTVSSSRFVFVPVNQFAGTNVSTIRVASAQNTTILAKAQRTSRFSVSNGLVRTSGPPATLVERATGKSLHAVKVSSVKNVKPAPISTSAGGRLAIVAPARERAAAMKESGAVKAAPPKVAGREAATAHAAPSRVSGGKPVVNAKQPAHAVSNEKRPAAPVPSSHETKPSRSTRVTTSAAHAAPSKEIHHEKGSNGPAPARSVEKRQEAPPPRVQEEHRAAANRPAEHPARPSRAEAPPPQAAQPHPAPPPAAAAKPPEHPQPQGQPKGQKKEKGQR